MPRLGRALNDAWRSQYPGQLPAYLLRLAVPDGSYDVNVVPDKRLVLLHDEQRLYDWLRQSIMAAVGGVEVLTQAAPHVTKSSRSSSSAVSSVEPEATFAAAPGVTVSQTNNKRTKVNKVKLGAKNEHAQV